MAGGREGGNTRCHSMDASARVNIGRVESTLGVLDRGFFGAPAPVAAGDARGREDVEGWKSPLGHR